MPNIPTTALVAVAGAPTAVEVTAWQAAPHKFTLAFASGSTDTFAGLAALRMELHRLPLQATGEALAQVEILNPSSGSKEFLFPGSHLNQPVPSAPNVGKFQILAYGLLDEDEDAETPNAPIPYAEVILTLKENKANAANTAPPPPVSDYLNATQIAALYATKAYVDTAVAGINPDLSAYSTTAQMTTAIGAASTQDRARANHTGTQAQSTIDGLPTALAALTAGQEPIGQATADGTNNGGALVKFDPDGILYPTSIQSVGVMTQNGQNVLDVGFIGTPGGVAAHDAVPLKTNNLSDLQSPITALQSLTNAGVQTVGNANAAISAKVQEVALTATLTAARTYTLPAASSYAAGTRIRFTDLIGTITSTNTATLQRAGSDTINGGTTRVLNVARASVTLVSNGANQWDEPSTTISVLNLVPMTGIETWVGSGNNITFKYSTQNNAQYGLYGINLCSDLSFTWSNNTSSHASGRDVYLKRHSTGTVCIDSDNSGTRGNLVTGSITATRGIMVGASTVGTLPAAASNTFNSYGITDALSPTLGATVASGGSAKCVVRSNGTAWKVTEVL